MQSAVASFFFCYNILQVGTRGERGNQKGGWGCRQQRPILHCIIEAVTVVS